MERNELKMVIDGLREYFNKCPLIGGEKVDVDVLGKKNSSYSIDTVPCDPIIKRYAGGGCMKQYCFVLSGRERYGMGKNCSNAAFYEKLADWIESTNERGELPDIGDGKTSQFIEVTSSGYMFEEDIQSAGYRLQGRLVYTQI